MADFLERIRLMIEASGNTTALSKASSDVKQLGTDAEATKGKTGGLSSALGDLGVTGAAGVATAGVAIAAFSLKAATQFEDLGVEVGKFSDATGTSTQQASRWIEVSKDLGIGADTVEKAMGRLNKEVGNAPQKFAALGITAQDANGRFLQAIDVLHNTKDSAQQAALGAQLFGKNWQSMAELVGAGADEISQRLDQVQSSKIFNQQAVDDAKKFRDEMDQLKDSVEGLTLTFGHLVANGIGPTLQGIGQIASQIDKLGSLAGGGGGLFGKIFGNLPGIGSIEGLSAAVGDNVDNIDRLKGAATAILPPLKALPFGLFDTKSNAEKAADALKKLNEAAKEVQQGIDLTGRSSAGFVSDMSDAARLAATNAANQRDLASAQQDAAQAAQEHQDALKALADGEKTAAEWTETLTKAQQKQAQTEEDLIGANIDLQKSLMDATTAGQEADKAAKTLAQSHGKNTKAAQEFAAANLDLESKMDASGKAAQALAEKQATASGTALTAAQSQGRFAAGMLQAGAASQTGRQDFLQLIGTLKSIPQDVRTKVTAAVNSGDIKTALNLLNSIQGDYTANVAIHVTGQNSLAAVSSVLRAGGGITKTRTPFNAAGGEVFPGELSRVNEQGAEQFIVGATGGTQVQSAGSFPKGVGGMAPVIIQNLNVTGTIDDATATKIAAAIYRVQRGRG